MVWNRFPRRRVRYSIITEFTASVSTTWYVVLNASDQKRAYYYVEHVIGGAGEAERQAAVKPPKLKKESVKISAP